MICGSNSHGGGNYQGGCGKSWNYNDNNNLYRPIGTAKQETLLTEQRNAREQLLRDKAQIESINTNLPPMPAPQLPDLWPTLRCADCQGKLEGQFHLLCNCCEGPDFRLCVRCVAKNKHLKHSEIEGGGVLLHCMQMVTE